MNALIENLTANLFFDSEHMVKGNEFCSVMKRTVLVGEGKDQNSQVLGGVGALVPGKRRVRLQ